MSKFSNSGNVILTLKVGLISTCVLSIGILLKNSAPFISDFVSSDVPGFWNVMLQWLKPPYLYLVINCIIISIVASSKLQQHSHESHDTLSTVSAQVLVGTQEKVVSGDHVRNEYVLGYGYINPTVEKEEEKKMMSDEMPVMMDGGDEVVAVRPPERSESMELLDLYEKDKEKGKEKPTVSKRFSHKKAVKANPEGGKAILKVSKAKRQDTLESTWKTITEGRAMPLTRHLKKSDTWDTQLRRQKTPPPPPEMKKAETFSDRTTTAENSSDNPARVKREPSLSQDELNRRVEAFIKKFNEEMRLQRQRSVEQYNEMIRRGAV
ncbi:topoisomerase 1-associated factor 1-like [Pistacia vera]|uniref:topoisomerase 1-associated factor 1-like n=1 Tax=Pistacia vera TaxID=55513 RepID=UPI001262EED8|nr:topoisomerase 1-associated factor 1-like [Pistacia vera]